MVSNHVSQRPGMSMGCELAMYTRQGKHQGSSKLNGLYLVIVLFTACNTSFIIIGFGSW